MRKPLPFAAGLLATILVAGAAGMAIGAFAVIASLQLRLALERHLISAF